MIAGIHKVDIRSGSPDIADVRVFIDDKEITSCTRVQLDLQAGERFVEVTLTLIAQLDAELYARLKAEQETFDDVDVSDSIADLDTSDGSNPVRPDQQATTDQD